MSHNELASGIHVSSQLTPDAIAAAKAAGIRTIINNRPDGEEAGQPASAALEAAARAHGLAYRHIPVTPGNISDAQVDAFRDALEACPKPALAFCKSGMRAASLWGLSQAGTRTTGDIVRRAAACGYDLASLAARLETRAATATH